MFILRNIYCRGVIGFLKIGLFILFIYEIDLIFYFRSCYLQCFPMHLILAKE